MIKDKNTQLTSVKILQDSYYNFKSIIMRSTMTLQKLTNRSIFLYLTDEDFKTKIETTDTLTISGSSF